MFEKALPWFGRLFMLAITVLSPATVIWSDEPAGKLPYVEVAPGGRGFRTVPGNEPFVPWGFNYDHDDAGRLLEDYWQAEWTRVEGDFQEMRDLGANVVRIHLQFGKFMISPTKPNVDELGRLAKLVTLAEKTGLYLDLTGLACYHKKDVPAWYDELDEEGRWSAQAAFWEAIAKTCRESPAIFCYDLMNEPVVPGGKRQDKDWLGPPFGDKYFVQCITLDQADRERPEIARLWIAKLTAAIRRQDQRHLVTVGLVDWSLDRPGLTSGFVPAKIAADLDFLCIHLYPKKDNLEADLKTLALFAEIGKPVVIEETFALQCSLQEFDQFITGSREKAAGWIGFYWGKTPDELRQGKTLGDAILLQWLEWFQTHPPKQPGKKPAGE